MTDEPPNEPAKPPRRRKRPPPTIDLSATEVAVAPPGAGTPPPETPASGAAGSGDARGQPSPRRLFEVPWALLGATVAGAAAVLLVLGILALLGVWPRGDASSADLAARMARIEAQPATRPDSLLDPKVLMDMAARLARIEATQVQPAPPLSDAALANRLTAIEVAARTVGDVVANLNRRNEDVTAAVRALRERVDATAAALRDLQTAERQRGPAVDKGDIDKLAARVAALESATRGVEEKLGSPANTDRNVRVAMLAAALKDAVERGTPFATEFAAVKPLIEAKTSAALEPFAATGVPTAAALGAELAMLVPAMSQALDHAASQGGVLSRLQANARRLVRIRPMDEPPGDEPADVLARVNARAAAGDIDGALAEIGKLPAPVREQAAAWTARAEARAAAIAAARRLAATALTAVGKAS